MGHQDSIPNVRKDDQESAHASKTMHFAKSRPPDTRAAVQETEWLLG